MEKQASYPKSRKLKKADGTIAFIWDNKLHNWDGPAYIPQGDMKKAEYYLHGIQKTKDEYIEAIREQTGLPWYKQSSSKGASRN